MRRLVFPAAIVSLAAFTVFWSGCATQGLDDDGNGTADSGPVKDTGTPVKDSGPKDTGTIVDTGKIVDTGTVADTGTTQDTGGNTAPLTCNNCGLAGFDCGKALFSRLVSVCSDCTASECCYKSGLVNTTSCLDASKYYK